MGSRAAVNVANQSRSSDNLKQFVQGVACFAYPLHPPQQKDKLRDEPLKELAVPCLFVSGTQDEMADRELLTRTVAQDMKNKSEIYWVEGGNHAHKVKGRSDEEVVEDMCDEFLRWSQTITKHD